MTRMFEILGKSVLMTLLIGVAGMLSAFPVMIGVGILNDYFPAIPALSFWETFWVVWAWGVFWGRMKFSADD